MDSFPKIRIQLLTTIKLLILLIIFACEITNNDNPLRQTVNTHKLFHSDSTEYLKVTISTLDSAKAQQIKHLLIYTENETAEIFDDYREPVHLFYQFLIVEIENHFGWEISDVFNAKLYCDYNGIEVELFEYEIVAFSRKIGRSWSRYTLENSGKVDLIVKPDFFDTILLDKFIPNEDSLDYSTKQIKRTEVANKIYNTGEYRLIYEAVVDPGIGINEFKVSDTWNFSEPTEVSIEYH
jgi:hypothetical protein